MTVYECLACGTIFEKPDRGRCPSCGYNELKEVNSDGKDNKAD